MGSALAFNKNTKAGKFPPQFYIIFDELFEMVISKMETINFEEK